MAARSAGLLMYRLREDALEVLLVHSGGPFWMNKDLGAWTLPKGEIAPNETPLDAACREFQEETGRVADGPFISLGKIKQRGGKTVEAWAFEGDCDAQSIRSNSFQMEWPPRSGQQREFPEIDRAGWFATEIAKVKINQAQVALIDELILILANCRPKPDKHPA